MAAYAEGLSGSPADSSEAQFPALGLRIPRRPAGSGSELDLRRDYGATGNGTHDDGPAFRALAADVNAGNIPAGTTVNLPPGTFRVKGNDPVIFLRPIVLRGAGADATVIRLEYTALGSRFLRVAGQGVYEMHTQAVLPSGVQGNGYPKAAFSPVSNVPRRGDRHVEVQQPELFGAGDNVYLLCDDFGPEIEYAANNRRKQHYLLKQHCAVKSVEGSTVWLDAPLREDFAGGSPRLYRWQPVVGFGLEQLTVDDQSAIPDSNSTTTFMAVEFDGVVDGWIWNTRFINNTSVPLRIARSRRVVVSESLFEGSRHVGAGGNGYLPQFFLTDDSLVEYSTTIGGRHALICDWSCWGNVFRYNRISGANLELHGEYSVENLYIRNLAPAATLDMGGGGDVSHGHDGPFNEARENLVASLRVLKPGDTDGRFIDNWYSDQIDDNGVGTVSQGNERVAAGWTDFPYVMACGRDHGITAENARPVPAAA
jgi:hypothetical protein